MQYCPLWWLVCSCITKTSIYYKWLFISCPMQHWCMKGSQIGWNQQSWHPSRQGNKSGYHQFFVISQNIDKVKWKSDRERLKQTKSCFWSFGRLFSLCDFYWKVLNQLSGINANISHCEPQPYNIKYLVQVRTYKAAEMIRFTILWFKLGKEEVRKTTVYTLETLYPKIWLHLTHLIVNSVLKEANDALSGWIHTLTHTMVCLL